MVPMDTLRPRSFANTQRASAMQRHGDEPRLSISLCDLSLRQQEAHMEEEEAADDDEDEEAEVEVEEDDGLSHGPQNSQNSQQCSLLPSHLDGELHFHPMHSVHVTALDKHTVARLELRADERTLVFTSRPLRASETVFVKVKAAPAARTGSLSYGVTSCDPAALRPSDLPSSPESLVDRKEFWAVGRVAVALHTGDILGFAINGEGEVAMSHNGASAGMQLCVDNSRPLWMFYGMHGAVAQLRILGGWHLSITRLMRGKTRNLQVELSRIKTFSLFWEAGQIMCHGIVSKSLRHGGRVIRAVPSHLNSPSLCKFSPYTYVGSLSVLQKLACKANWEFYIDHMCVCVTVNGHFFLCGLFVG